MGMQAPWLVALAVSTACIPDLGLDEETDGTWIIATGDMTGITDVDICPGPSELLSCNGQAAFAVAYGEGSENAAMGFFGMLEADFASLAHEAPITVTRGSDGATEIADAEPFELLGPGATELINRGSTIQLTWTPSGGDRVSWTGDVECAGSDPQTTDAHGVDDTGTLTLSTRDLPAGAGTCTATVTLTRERDGTVAGAFPVGSKFTVDEVRTVSFELVE